MRSCGTLRRFCETLSMQDRGPLKRLGKHFTHWNPWNPLVCYAVCVVDQEPQRRQAAIDKLQHLKAVFSEDGTDGLQWENSCMPWTETRRGR